MFTKTIIKNNRKAKFGIIMERFDQNKFRITDALYSRNGKDFVSYGDILKNNPLIYRVSKRFGGTNKLVFKRKRVKTCEIGTLTWWKIDKNVLIPCSLIDESIEKIK